MATRSLDDARRRPHNLAHCKTMVKIRGASDYDRLDAFIRELSVKHNLRLEITGWTRKTYDAYQETGRKDPGPLRARVESFATTNGEIVVFDESAFPFAEELGAILEKEFGVEEAVVVQQSRPG